jgi:NitT/TauT family transport system ATP-binding protein
MNGNAITVSPRLYAAIAAEADGDVADPMVTANALTRVVSGRKSRGQEPLTFGMTFPYSTHNYHLRFWMAAGGVDPDHDVRLVVLPPPYMVDSIANRHVDGFCVGAPWNSIAVDLGVGNILHFGSEILQRAAEKVLAVRAAWADENPDNCRRLVRAHARAAAFVEDPANRYEVATILAAPDRVGVAAEVVRRTLEGRLKISPDGMLRTSGRYLLVGRANSARPDPVQAAWLYAQMVRWGHALMSPALLAQARAVFRSDLYDSILGSGEPIPPGEPADGIGAFAGPSFNPDDIAAHLGGWKTAVRDSFELARSL